MTAKPGCHNDSLWKDVKGEEEGEERVGRCTDVSLAPPSDAGRMRSSSCWRKTRRRLGFDKLFVILSVLLCIFLSPCFLAIIYSFQTSPFSLSSPLPFPSSVLLLNLSAPWHSLFLPACFLFFLPVTTPLADVSCGVLCSVATNQVLHSSPVICTTENCKCALSPLLCLLSTLSSPSRSDWNWAKSLSGG